MKIVLKGRLALACCAALMLTVAGCGDDSGASGSSKDGTKCGDAVCTGTQVCEEGVCKEPGEDPCKQCTAEQTCENGVCKDPEDPCKKCTANQTCENGVCKEKKPENPCGEECTDGKVCDPNAKQCVDPPEDPCSLCTEDQDCVNHQCIDKDYCANKTCPDGQKCDNTQKGECVTLDPCETVVCQDAQTCIKARCIDDACIENGAEKDCGSGQVCAKGECVDDGCQGKTCDEGWQCIRGICEETACIDYFCEDGRTCKGGKCVDNECLEMTCEGEKLCSKGNCIYEACLNKEPCGTGKTCNAEGNCEYIVEPAISLDETRETTTTESGETIGLTLHLNNVPTSEVRITCEIETDSPNKEVDVACEEIVFNADNWEIEQTIIITGVDDYIKDGDQKYKIKITTVSDDSDFNGLTAESDELTNTDTTKPGFVFSETSLTTYEDQEQEPATFTVQLSSIPSSDVSLSISSTNDNEGVPSPKQLKFTKDNWNVPQTVTVKGVDDSVKDGNVNYTIFFAPAESSDEDYAGIQPSTIKAVNVDNDVAGMSVNIPTEDYAIIEDQNSTVTVKLNTEPKNDVKVSVSIDDESELISDTKEIIFNKDNWQNGVDIVLSGVEDHEIDGDQKAKITFKATSEDEDYNNLEPLVFEAIVKDIDTAEIITSLGVSPIVKEGSNDFVTMTVSLSSKPKKDVKIDVSITDSSELKINKKTLNFKPNQWEIPIDILVNSVDDDIVDGNIKSKVVFKVSSGDTNFDGKTNEIEFTTVDNDVAGFVISSNAASFPENSGSTASMTIALLAQPTADVTVNVSSSDSSELAVTTDSVLKFTTSNWKTPQTVNVKVVDDNIADGTQKAVVKFEAESLDKNFNGISAKSAEYTIIDNDSASIVLVVKESTITQASPSTTATLRLGAEPNSTVTLTMKASNTSVISFKHEPLVFTSSNWDKEQLITIDANFSALSSAWSNESIYATASGDIIYSNIQSNKAELTLVKISEVQEFEYTGNVQSVTLPRGKFKFEVWGANGGNYSSWQGGRGGYSTGIIELKEATTAYIYVGGAGTDYTGQQNNKHGGFNGGGNQVTGDGYSNFLGGGGGATDIRLKTDSTFARVIVAGGGGGVSDRSGNGGAGGGASGIAGNLTESVSAQVGGGASVAVGGTGYEQGSFGAGGTAFGHGGGGGGGWYGGGGGAHCGGHGGGGSGWTHTSTNYTNWKSGNATDAGKYLLTSFNYMTNAQTIAGNASMPSPVGGTETGHTGKGFARITLVK